MGMAVCPQEDTCHWRIFTYLSGSMFRIDIHHMHQRAVFIRIEFQIVPLGSTFSFRPTTVDDLKIRRIILDQSIQHSVERTVRTGSPDSLKLACIPEYNGRIRSSDRAENICQAIFQININNHTTITSSDHDPELPERPIILTSLFSIAARPKVSSNKPAENTRNILSKKRWTTRTDG